MFILAACALRSRWVDVWKCYQGVKALGIQLEEATYNILWQTAAKVRPPCAAILSVFDFMIVIVFIVTHCMVNCRPAMSHMPSPCLGR